LDTGDIIAQKRFAISRTDTVKTLLDKIVVLAPQLLAERINAIERGTAPRLKQDESQASYTPRRTPAQSEIDWSESPERIYNFIRALAPPYPNAFAWVGSRKLVIPSARLERGRLWMQGFLG
jgi:UDP-4-amino-4-deoxy-L-arabinose formyltransferase/UDP-glucuronic acid dehydrogenase (UDP-4-keto-hexauronic acid decarboxylating)